MANPLEGDIKVPGVGQLPKVAVVGGVGVVIVLIILERRKAAAAAGSATAAAAPGAYPPDGTTGDPSDPNSTDPATGQTYGNESAASPSSLTPFDSADAYGWDGTYGVTSDPNSMDTSTGQTYGAEGYSGSVNSYGGTPSGPPFSTDAEWSQYVLNYFSTNSYSDIPGRTDAVGLYLAGEQLTVQQSTYIHDASAIGGSPPVAGPNGYPPSLRTTGNTGSVSQVAVPKVTGMAQAAAYGVISAAGLRPSGTKDVPGKVLTVDSQSPAAGTQVNRGATVTLKSSVHAAAAAAPAAKAPVINTPYIVKVNENLEEIAAAHGLTVTELAHANGLGTGAGLRAGQKILV